MQWLAFHFEGKIFDLSHLHPCEITFERLAKDGKAAIIYTVDVTYSLHCFAKEIPQSGTYDKRLEYSDSRETRLFDLDRFDLSKKLPAVIRSLANRKCLHTWHSNYLTIDYQDEEGRRIEYDVFFTVSKSMRRGRLNLYVQSAYRRDDPKNRPPSARPIGFLVILHNTLNKLPIRH